MDNSKPSDVDRFKSADVDRGPLTRLIDVIANAAVAGWGPTVRTALLLIVGAIAVALVVLAGTGHP